MLMEFNFYDLFTVILVCITIFGGGYLLNLNSKINDKYNEFNSLIKKLSSENTETVLLVGGNHKKDEFSDEIKNNIYLINNPNRFLEFLTKSMRLKKNINLIIHTEGASVADCDLLCSYLFNYSNKYQINAYVPYYAFSSGTCIALSCSKLYLGDLAVLGPTDPQIDYNYGESGEDTFSAQRYVELINKVKDNEYEVNVDTINFLMGADAEILINDNNDLVKKILSKHIENDEDVEIAVEYLNNGTIPHYKPIDLNKVNELKINYELISNDDIYQLASSGIEFEGQLDEY